MRATLSPLSVDSVNRAPHVPWIGVQTATVEVIHSGHGALRQVTKYIDCALGPARPIRVGRRSVCFHVRLAMGLRATGESQSMMSL